MPLSSGPISRVWSSCACTSLPPLSTWSIIGCVVALACKPSSCQRYSSIWSRVWTLHVKTPQLCCTDIIFTSLRKTSNHRLAPLSVKPTTDAWGRSSRLFPDIKVTFLITIPRMLLHKLQKCGRPNEIACWLEWVLEGRCPGQKICLDYDPEPCTITSVVIQGQPPFCNSRPIWGCDLPGRTIEEGWM